MSSPASISPPTVADDLPCAACGYNLRTRPADSVCPECALPVATSIRAAADQAAKFGPPLSAEPQRWLRITGISFLAYLAGAFCIWTTTLLPQPLGGTSTLTYILLFLGLTTMGISSWFMTRRGACAASDPTIRRWAARVSILAALLYHSGVLVYLLARDLDVAFIEDLIRFYYALNILATFACFIWLLKVARRTHRRVFIRWCWFPLVVTSYMFLGCLMFFGLWDTSAINLVITPDVAVIGAIYNLSLETLTAGGIYPAIYLLCLFSTTFTLLTFGVLFLQAARAHRAHRLS